VTNICQKDLVNILFDSMSSHMSSGKRIEVRGFGSFVVREYQAYEGRNPKTGETIRIETKEFLFSKLAKI